MKSMADMEKYKYYASPMPVGLPPGVNPYGGYDPYMMGGATPYGGLGYGGFGGFGGGYGGM